MEEENEILVDLSESKDDKLLVHTFSPTVALKTRLTGVLQENCSTGILIDVSQTTKSLDIDDNLTNTSFDCKEKIISTPNLTPTIVSVPNIQQLTAHQMVELFEQANTVAVNIQMTEERKCESPVIFSMESCLSDFQLPDDISRAVTSTPAEKVPPGVVEHFRGIDLANSPTHPRSASTISTSSVAPDSSKKCYRKSPSTSSFHQPATNLFFSMKKNGETGTTGSIPMPEKSTARKPLTRAETLSNTAKISGLIRPSAAPISLSRVASVRSSLVTSHPKAVAAPTQGTSHEAGVINRHPSSLRRETYTRNASTLTKPLPISSTSTISGSKHRLSTESSSGLAVNVGTKKLQSRLGGSKQSLATIDESQTRKLAAPTTSVRLPAKKVPIAEVAAERKPVNLKRPLSDRTKSLKVNTTEVPKLNQKTDDIHRNIEQKPKDLPSKPKLLTNKLAPKKPIDSKVAGLTTLPKATVSRPSLSRPITKK